MAEDVVARVDTHVHVFDHRLPLAPGRRYQPDHDATPQDLQLQMRTAGVTQAILVQPSFLGTDNSYILHAVAAARDVFAGIAVIEPEMPAAALDALRQAGIVGVRLNCLGKAPPDLSRGLHRDLAERLAASRLVLEIQAEAEQWQTIAPTLPALPCTMVVDHFGRTPTGHDSGGFEALLAASQQTEQLWFKFSGPYRFAAGAAGPCAQALLDAVGPGRIVWGSDWPWTQCDAQHNYQDTYDWLSLWVPDAATRQRILGENPARLFGLDFATP